MSYSEKLYSYKESPGYGLCLWVYSYEEENINWQQQIKKKKKLYKNFLLPQHPNRRLVFRDGEMELDTNFNEINRPFGPLENQRPHWFSTLRKQEFGMENEEE